MKGAAEEALMKDIARDAVEPDRNTRRYTAESTQGLARRPGLIVVAAGVLAVVVCAANFALGEVSGGLAAAIVGLLAFGVGLDWLGMDRRRIRQAERERSVSRPAG
jgi:hypothetical protein